MCGAGTLPASWGTGFPAIYDLNLEGLKLSGSLPEFKHDELEQLNVRAPALRQGAGSQRRVLCRPTALGTHQPATAHPGRLGWLQHWQRWQAG